MAKKRIGYLKYMIYMCLIQASEFRYTYDNEKDHIVKSNDHASFYVFFGLPGPQKKLVSKTLIDKMLKLERQNVTLVTSPCYIN